MSEASESERAQCEALLAKVLAPYKADNVSATITDRIHDKLLKEFEEPKVSEFDIPWRIPSCSAAAGT